MWEKPSSLPDEVELITRPALLKLHAPLRFFIINADLIKQHNAIQTTVLAPKNTTQPVVACIIGRWVQLCVSVVFLFHSDSNLVKE